MQKPTIQNGGGGSKIEVFGPFSRSEPNFVHLTSSPLKRVSLHVRIDLFRHFLK